MEKIKEALAKAKLTNSLFKVESPAIEKEMVPEPIKPAFVNTENELDKIKYHNSPVIKLDLNHLEKHRIVSHSKNDANSYLFDSLRTQILQKMEENNWRTIAIVSPTPQSGKTLVSINLAISIAQQPQKTAILVDQNLLGHGLVPEHLGLEKSR